MNKNLINYSKGPQFRGGNAIVPFFIAMLFLMFSIASLVNNALIYLLVTLPLLVVIVNFILDRQGVEIDKAKGLVRLYKLDFFIKYGEWEELKNYYQVTLDKDIYIIKQMSLYSSYTRTNGGKSITNETHSRFIISLVNHNPQKNIILLEKNNYWETVDLCLKLSKNLNLAFDDLFDTRLMNSRSRRR